MADYIAELHKLALHCEFGKFLNDSLWDYLVCELSTAGNTAAQKQLLLQTELTLDKAPRLAQGKAAAKEGTRKLQLFLQFNKPCKARLDSQVKLVVIVVDLTTLPALPNFAKLVCNKCHKGASGKSLP